MKLQSIVLTPIVFITGVLSIVLLQYFDIVTINPASNERASSAQGARVEADTINTQTGAAPLAKSGAKDGATSTAYSYERLSERIDELQQQIRSTTVNADVMQSEIDQLAQQVDSATSINEFLPNGQSANAADEATSIAAVEQSVQQRFNRGWGFDGDSDEQYDRLVAAGVDPLVAAEFKSRNDQWSLQRLELVDQATREGWRRSDQFGERMGELREQRPDIRAELGDDRYDSYLFAAGDFNRVQITSIIDGSAASLAGIESGDVVVSYANQRMFTMRELQQATSSGSRGESVQVNVLRNGELLTIELPRGPLGVSLIGARAEPTAL